MLQNAVREKNQVSYDAYSANARKQVRAVTLRGLLEFDYDKAKAIPIEQVEPWHEIVKRFATGAMSYGSISLESHAALAIAMNRLVRPSPRISFGNRQLTTAFRRRVPSPTLERVERMQSAPRLFPTETRCVLPSSRSLPDVS